MMPECKNKVKIPQHRVVVNYDQEYDVLYLSIDEPRPSYGDEEIEGIIVRRDIETDVVTGVTIIDYEKRNKIYIDKYIPFTVDFVKIDQVLSNQKSDYSH